MPDAVRDHATMLGDKPDRHITPFSLLNDALRCATGKMVYYGLDHHGVPAFLVAE